MASLERVPGSNHSFYTSAVSGSSLGSARLPAEGAPSPSGSRAGPCHRSFLCNDRRVMELDTFWLSCTIADAQEQGYTHLRATCPGCGRIADVPSPLLLGRKGTTRER